MEFFGARSARRKKCDPGDTVKNISEDRNEIYPLRLSAIDKAQRLDPELMKIIRSDNNPYTLNTFRGGGKHLSLLSKDKRASFDH